MNATRYLPFVGRLFIGLPFMASGLLQVAAYGAGALSIDNRLSKNCAQSGGISLGG